MLTTPQIRSHTKTVTRRAGWYRLQPGQKFWAVEKAMGLKKGERIVRLALLECLSIRKEPLSALLEDANYGASEMILEGFPNMEPDDFIRMFRQTHKGVTPHTLVNRIQFSYGVK